MLVPIPMFLTSEKLPLKIADKPPLTIKPIRITVTSVITLTHLC